MSEKVKLLRKRRVISEFGPIPASVDFLRRELDKPISKEDRYGIYALLLSECSTARNDELYFFYLRRQVQDFPGDPLPLCSLAAHLAIRKSGDKEKHEAISTAKRAVELAIEKGRLVRYAATNLARTALWVDDYDALHRALAVLISEAGQKREEDTGYEFDFLGQIDPTRCNADLLRNYRSLMSG